MRPPRAEERRRVDVGVAVADAEVEASDRRSHELAPPHHGASRHVDAVERPVRAPEPVGVQHGDPSVTGDGPGGPDGPVADGADGRGGCRPVVESPVPRAVAAGAAEAWASRAPRERAEILRNAYGLMTERLDEIASAIVREMGKPFVEARGEAGYAAEFLRWYSEEAVRIGGEYGVAPAGTNIASPGSSVTGLRSSEVTTPGSPG